MTLGLLKQINDHRIFHYLVLAPGKNNSSSWRRKYSKKETGCGTTTETIKLRSGVLLKLLEMPWPHGVSYPRSA